MKSTSGHRARVRQSTAKTIRIHDTTVGKLALPEKSTIDSLVDRIEPLALHLQALKSQAAVLGVLVGDRELLECRACGLLEDVLADSRLVTYRGTNVRDTGLRFVQVSDDSFRCPSCARMIRLSELE